VQVLAALEKPVDVDFSKLALEECIAYLQKESKIPIWLDQPNVTDEGVELDQPVTLKLKATRLESVLNLLLHPLELAYIPENEVLMITTASKAGEKMFTRTYPVRDLVLVPKLPDDESTDTRPEVPANPGAQKGLTSPDANPTEKKPSTGAANQVLKQSFGGGRGGGMSPSVGASVLPGYGPGYMDFTGLMNLITTTIQPDTWENLSGPGSMMPYRACSSLVIRQRWDVHREVLQLLRDLREAKRLAPRGEAMK
jgi:general secretion pathway protein D